jgi:hypothetical protein
MLVLHILLLLEQFLLKNKLVPKRVELLNILQNLQVVEQVINISIISL